MSQPPRVDGTHGDPWRQRPAAQWWLRLLGEVEARSGDVVLRHWPSRHTALVLALLALEPDRLHPREVLIERVWPGVTPQVGRNRLRQALSSLRRLLDRPGSGLPQLVLADRQCVRLQPHGLRCDVVEFERALRERRWSDAKALYRGDLLPGSYEDWVTERRALLAARHEALASLAISMGDEPPPGRGADRHAAPPATPAAPAPPGLGAIDDAPLASGPLFGRDAELRAASDALRGCRLVTIVGAGGCGKTRLAAAAMGQVAEADLRVFVPLADCHDGAAAAAQLRASLALPPSSAPAMARVLPLLAGRCALLVLDNLEQMPDAAAWVAALLQAAPSLRLLCTSRRPLGVAGEHCLPLQPLPVPPEGASLAEVDANPGVRLFVQAARAVSPAFQVSARNQAQLAALCRCVDGLPLALELAAARARAWSLPEMLGALRPPAGAGPARAGGAPADLLLSRRPQVRGAPRHDSMHATIDWSWRLLTPSARGLLAALSQLRGAWTLDDAAALVAQSREAVRSGLESLLADSLVRAADTQQATPRYRLPDLVRDFAARQLRPRQLGVLRQRLSAHVLALARGGQALREADRPMLEQALRLALDSGDAAQWLPLALALGPFWRTRGMDAALLARLAQAASGQPAGADTSALCNLLAGLLLDAADAPGAQAQARRALWAAGERPRLRAAALCTQVRVAADTERHGRGLARLLDEALALCGDDARLQADALVLQASLAMRYDAAPVRASQLLQRAADRFRAAGAMREAQRLRYDQALCLRAMGRLAAALEQAELSEIECAHAEDAVHRLRTINLQGVILSQMRRWQDAVDAYRRCAEQAWAAHVHYWLVFAIWNHGRNLARLRRPGLAARLSGFAECHWQRHFAPLAAEDHQHLRLVRRLVRAQLGRAAAQEAWLEGAGWTLHQAVDAVLGGSPPGPAFEGGLGPTGPPEFAAG